MQEAPEILRFQDQEFRDGEHGGYDDDEHDEQQLEFLHAPIMRRVELNSDPQVPLLPSLPQRDSDGLNGPPFLLLYPGFDLPALCAPALAYLETGDTFQASRLVPSIEPKRDRANGESKQLSNIIG